MKVKNMDEYYDVYLQIDVLLLADVLKEFRKTCLESYTLDPCHYFSPGLSWDAMMKRTGVTLDLMTDIIMHLFIKKGIRDGVSYIAHRHSKATTSTTRRRLVVI